MVTAIVLLARATTGMAVAGEPAENRWRVADPTLTPGPAGSFSETSVKDPTIVYHGGRWHLFFTARGQNEYTTGYVAAKELSGLQSAKRHELPMIRGKGRYGCAPQVFYYQPQQQWYLIFQNRDSNYQPMFSTTATIAEPQSWSQPGKLTDKDSRAKWIDFWVIADTTRAYLFYTQGHQGVMVRSTSLDAFPAGWGEAEQVFDNIHEAVHVYKTKKRNEFHMIYELNQGGVRCFGLATAGHLKGPWHKVTDRYATGGQLEFVGSGKPWTEMVSHGEAIRTGYDQRMEYAPTNCRWLIQGIPTNASKVSYPSLPWKLGIITKPE